jgi:hypothetical protein
VLVIARKAGQLANRLVQASHLLAAAAEQRRTLVHLAFEEYAPYFVGTRGDLLCRWPARRSLLPPARWLRRLAYVLGGIGLRIFARVPLLGPLVRGFVWRDLERPCWLEDPPLAGLVAGSRLLFLEGWMLRSRQVASHLDAIRRHFAPVPVHAERVEALVTPLRTGCDLLVGIHVRRGDYATHLGGKWFWPVEAYADLMRRVLALHPGRRIRFLVCSNEALDASRFPGLPVAFGTGHLVEDLYALARCDRLLGPPSSFSVWASFYGSVPLRLLERPDAPLRDEDFRVHPL